MSTTATTARQHAGLQDFFSYPFAPALQDRRTRRVAQGTSLEHGAQPYGARTPSPLTPLEEAILIASTSVTGAVMHDGPTQKVDGTPELGTMFLEVAGRAASSADNAQATSFFMNNDEGVWLIERPRGPKRSSSSARSRRAGRTARRTIGSRSPTRSSARSTTADSLPRQAVAVLPRLERADSNAPGTTQFLPVVDNTRQYINVLLILLSRAARQGAAVHRRLAAVPAEERDGVGGLGGVEARVRGPDPYQPIGGLKRARGGFASPGHARRRWARSRPCAPTTRRTS